MAKLICKMRLAKETKGALMYQEVDEKGEDTILNVGTQYIRKSALGSSKPETLTLTIEYK